MSGYGRVTEFYIFTVNCQSMSQKYLYTEGSSSTVKLFKIAVILSMNANKVRPRVVVGACQHGEGLQLRPTNQTEVSVLQVLEVVVLVRVAVLDGILPMIFQRFQVIL